jgi:predicted ATP-dependent serine protease
MICPHCKDERYLMAPGQMYHAYPGCGGFTASETGGRLKGVRATDVVPLSEVQESEIERMSVGGTWDKAWGGGVVPSLIFLITGEPGSGKSTILIQQAAKFIALTGKWAYFISAEQSAGEIKAANKRLGLEHTDRLLVLREFGGGGEIDPKLFKSHPPCIIIVDSISAMCGKNKEEAVLLAKTFKKYSVQYKCPSFLIAHMNKTGDIGGFFTLQYDVDALASLEHPDGTDPRCYDRTVSGREFRKLIVFKHRFGPTKHDHWFEMTETGLHDVPADYEKRFKGEEPDEAPEPPPPPPSPRPTKPSMARLSPDAIMYGDQKLVRKPRKPSRAAAVEGEALRRPKRREIGE